VVASVEARIWMHLDNISLPQIVLSSNYDAPSWKISSRRSVQFLDESTSLGANFSLFTGSLFHSMRNTQSKSIFFLADITRLTRFVYHDLIYNKTGFGIPRSTASRCHEHCCPLGAKRQAIIDDQLIGILMHVIDRIVVQYHCVR